MDVTLYLTMSFGLSVHQSIRLWTYLYNRLFWPSSWHCDTGTGRVYGAVWSYPILLHGNSQILSFFLAELKSLKTQKKKKKRKKKDEDKYFMI